MGLVMDQWLIRLDTLSVGVCSWLCCNSQLFQEVRAVLAFPAEKAECKGLFPVYSLFTLQFAALTSLFCCFISSQTLKSNLIFSFTGMECDSQFSYNSLSGNLTSWSFAWSR